MSSTSSTSFAVTESPGETLATVTERLNHLSVVKRHEAFRDIDWDVPDHRIDRDDPRFRLPPDHPLGGTEWYRSLPEPTQVSLGLDVMCQVLRYGIAFESCLSRGLLEFVETLPARCPQYRYAMHEIVEESHHSMMFREFIDRSRCEPAGLPAFNRFYNRLIVRWAGTFPELFFLHVLSGEIFTDHDNRERLAQRSGQHPLVRRMIQIHGWRRPATYASPKPSCENAFPGCLAGESGMRSPLGLWPMRSGAGSAHERRVRAIVAPVYQLLGVDGRA